MNPSVSTVEQKIVGVVFFFFFAACLGSVTYCSSRTSPGSTRPRRSSKRSSTSSKTRTATRKLGARIPHGVLLYGLAGDRQDAARPRRRRRGPRRLLPHLGLGVRRGDRRRRRLARARSLQKGQRGAPAIIFIDELDAIGRSRSGNVGGLSGGNDEREQTLNQILTEMDGFEPGTDVIVLGATNRPEILDQALLRPGRFDRRIAVNPPDRNGRVAILEIHTRWVTAGRRRRPGRIAASIPGSTGADIAMLVNEAALFAARREHPKVEQRDFTDAIEKILLGAERQVVMTEDDRRRTAYHESGHALVGMLTPAPTRSGRSRSSPAGRRSA